MRGLWQDLTDLVMPTDCGGCGRQREVLCARCREVLCGSRPRRARPAPEPPWLPRVYAAAPYRGEVRSALLAHKERGVLGLARPMGEALAGAVAVGAVDGCVSVRSDVVGGAGGRRGSAEGRSVRGGLSGGACRGCEGRARAEGYGGCAGCPGSEGCGARAEGRAQARGRVGRARAAGGARGAARWRAVGVLGWGTASAARPSGPPGWPVLPPSAGPLLLVPVPSARAVVRARGHDPTRRIALSAAARLRGAGQPARVLSALRQRRPVVDQAGLDLRERRANLSGALTAAPGSASLLAAGARIVLVDDLMTSGSSLAEGLRALIAAGVEKRISAAVVAASPTALE